MLKGRACLAEKDFADMVVEAERGETVRGARFCSSFLPLVPRFFSPLSCVLLSLFWYRGILRHRQGLSFLQVGVSS